MSPRVSREEKYRNYIKDILISGNYIDGRDFSGCSLPNHENVRNWLEERFQIHTNRNNRVVLVEDFFDLKVLIQIPNGKTEYDFNVWIARMRNNEIIELRIPTHDYLANWFIQLKRESPIVDEFLINAVIKLVRDRFCVDDVVDRYFKELDTELIRDIKKFLLTLKWIVLEEDANYPPPKYLGSRYTLAVYSLLNVGFELKDIRRIIRF